MEPIAAMEHDDFLLLQVVAHVKVSSQKASHFPEQPLQQPHKKYLQYNLNL